MDKKIFNLECACDEHSVRFTKTREEGEVSIDYMVSAFYSKQDSVLSTIWNRLRLGLSIIFKGEYMLYALYIDNEDTLRDLAKFLEPQVKEEKINLEIETFMGGVIK